MKHFIWFDSQMFVANLVHDFLVDKNLKAFTPENLENFTYIVEDLSPEFLVADWDSVSGNPKHFFQQIESSEKLKALPFVLVIPDVQDQRWSGFVDKLNFKGTILKPIQIDSLDKILEKLLLS